MVVVVLQAVISLSPSRVRRRVRAGGGGEGSFAASRVCEAWRVFGGHTTAHTRPGDAGLLGQSSVRVKWFMPACGVVGERHAHA